MDKLKRDAPIAEDVLVNLLYRAQEQADSAAFDGLYLLYADRIYYYLASRLRHGESAEDVTSEVFLHLFEKISHYQVAPNDNVAIFSAWLFKIAHNKMIDALRTKQRVKHVDLSYAEPTAAVYPIDEVQERIEFEAILSKLDNLDADQRKVIMLRYIEGLSTAETATAMRKSESAVKGLRYRALQNLRRHVQV
jgi:RNA polymerase sigma-70 factor (ECF subfamily)